MFRVPWPLETLRPVSNLVVLSDPCSSLALRDSVYRSLNSGQCERLRHNHGLGLVQTRTGSTWTLSVPCSVASRNTATCLESGCTIRSLFQPCAERFSVPVTQQWAVREAHQTYPKSQTELKGSDEFFSQKHCLCDQIDI